ncbi:MBL fold metallo-hydrolase [Ectobacillus antri]|jgi:glyoxylase-like metal-dependent hydrolase (beta-lactamase superfamily II)|uniref:MBL fold metallo-hydrolase n=1 Tax=Ectobacillus antri TaxID=2486280 RepID=A0ABT6H1W6_9BACI|nr:MBL fold metallo-hydrolase [Ectobacillus antri]MDG4655646.1 MBL fold metallo-hydrolase [Ectobacillus antri]MDG5753404.1 MBL fold metallo-hydrolase [Ectobacillus antri]
MQIHCLPLPVPFATETVNTYLIKGDALTLIDTGTKTEETRQALVHQLAQFGYEIKDIETVVLTHHHADHSGLLGEFSDRTNIVGHPLNEPWITQNVAFIQKYERFSASLASELGVPEAFIEKGLSLTNTLKLACKRSLTRSVCEGDEIAELPGFRVIETPGHASTHIALYREQDGLMIGGDVLLARISSNPLLEPPYEGGEREKPLLAYNHSLRRLAEMPISRIMTGHGEDVTEVEKLVRERLQKQQKRAEQVLQMIKKRPMTAFEVCQALFPGIYQKQLALTISETVGQLDFLEYNQKVKVDSVSGVLIYQSR